MSTMRVICLFQAAFLIGLVSFPVLAEEESTKSGNAPLADEARSAGPAAEHGPLRNPGRETAWVVVEHRPPLVPVSVTGQDWASPGQRSAYIAHKDPQGRFVGPPGGRPSFNARALFPAPAQPVTFAGTTAHGGVGIDTSHLKSFAIAVIGPDGRVEYDCVQETDPSAAIERVAEARRVRNVPSPNPENKTEQ